ncbi:alpha/beta hydrolase [Fulvimonas yonginensis]|uniref:Alpha/beta hydrolase n=1 Tax=Fulvimonas yonginensis TaxID=1495200 RepID=A0ABU8JE47_9GAMM
MPATSLLLGSLLALAAPAMPHAHAYREVTAHALKACVFQPGSPASAPRAAVLLLHPGGWRAGEAAWEFDEARRFAALGLVAVAVDYRLADGGSGPVDALAHTCAAFAWTRAHARALGVDPSRIAGYGESAGGQLVPAAGVGLCPGRTSTARPHLMLLASPLLDTTQPIYASLLCTPARAAAYSPLAHAGAMPPTLVVQGEADNVAPAAAAKAFCAKASHAGGTCRLALYPKLGHLLTRDLLRQEADIDPDPQALADAGRRQRRFLAEHRLLTNDPAAKATSP